MLPDELKTQLERKIAGTAHPRELVVDVIFAMQDHYGYLSDAAVTEAAALVGMTTALTAVVAVTMDQPATAMPMMMKAKPMMMMMAMRMMAMTVCPTMAAYLILRATMATRMMN